MEVTGGFLLLLAWLNYTDTQGLLLPALWAATLHELGHLLAIISFGGHVTCLRLSAAGAELRLGGVLSYGAELVCALAGPTVNLALAYCAAQTGTERGFLFAGLNLTQGVFNLLPVSVLDGGRCICAIAAMVIDPDKVNTLRRAMDYVMTTLLVAAGAIIFWQTRNLTALIVAAWLLWVVR